MSTGADELFEARVCMNHQAYGLVWLRKAKSLGLVVRVLLDMSKANGSIKGKAGFWVGSVDVQIERRGIGLV